MKLVDLQNPIALAKIIANSNANSIPVNATGTSYASQIEGFPAVTMIPEEQGGEAPHGLDFNGFLKMLSSHVFNIQNGTPETFNPSVSSLIGGYPKNAQLWLIDDNNSRYLKSTKDDNTDNFLTTPSVIGTSWVDAFPTKDYVDNADRGLQAQITTNANNIATKANNNAVVHLAGTETITGAKTFTANILEKANIQMQSTTAAKGTAPESSVYQMLAFYDKNGFNQGNKTAQFYTAYSQSNNQCLLTAVMEVFKPVANSTDTASIKVYYPETGNPYTSAPAPTDDTTSSTQIDTVGARNTKLANYVTLGTSQTITGAKTFTEDVNITGNASVHVTRTVSGLDYSGFLVQNTSLTKGTAPSTSCGGQWLFQAKDGINEANRIGGVYSRVRASGETTNPGAYETLITAYKPEANSTTNADIRIIYPTSGSAYTTAPASDVNGSIVTTVGKNKSSSGYYKLGNGLIVQWGNNSSTTVGRTISFPTAFSGTNYGVSIVSINSSVTGDYTNIIQDKTSTGFKANTNKPISWVATGY